MGVKISKVFNRRQTDCDQIVLYEASGRGNEESVAECFVVLRDGTQIVCDKEKICRLSPLLKMELEQQCADFPRIFLNISLDIMEQVMMFVNTGQCKLSMKNIESLVRITMRLEMHELKTYCEHFLISEFGKKEMCFTIYSIANRLGFNSLSGDFKGAISANFNEFARRLMHSNSDDLKDLHVRDFMALLSNDNLQVSPEDIVFDLIARWASINMKERAKYLCDLLTTCRLGVVSSFYRDFEIPIWLRNNRHYISTEISHTILRKCLFYSSDRNAADSITDINFRPRITNKVVFIIGGDMYNFKNSKDNGYGYETLMEVYDPLRTRFNPVIIPSNIGFIQGTARIGNTLYVFSGTDIQERPLNRKTNKFMAVNLLTHSWEVLSPYPYDRQNCLFIANGSSIFVIGGCDGNRTVALMEKYDTITKLWTPMASMKKARSKACAVLCRNHIIVVGGQGDKYALNGCEIYSIENNVWKSFTDLHSARSGSSLIYHEKRLFLLGGVNWCNVPSEKVWVYNFEDSQWKAHSKMNVPRCAFAAAVVNDDIIVFGGYDGSSILCSTEILNISSQTKQWKFGKDLLAIRTKHQACVVDDIPNIRLYTFQQRQ